MWRSHFMQALVHNLRKAIRSRFSWVFHLRRDASSHEPLGSDEQLILIRVRLQQQLLCEATARPYYYCLDFNAFECSRVEACGCPALKAEPDIAGIGV